MEAFECVKCDHSYVADLRLRCLKFGAVCATAHLGCHGPVKSEGPAEASPPNNGSEERRTILDTLNTEELELLQVILLLIFNHVGPDQLIHWLKITVEDAVLRESQDE